MRQIPALTSVRCFAAMMVFVYHYVTMPGRRHFGEDPRASMLYRLFDEWQFGVTLFFVLSGFLLTARYFDSIHSRVDFKTYWIKRIARIMPLYWTLCIAYMAYRLYHQQEELSSYLVYFTLTQSFFSKLKFGNIGVAWSLTVEETFYLSLPVLVVALRRVWSDQRRLIVNLVAVVLLLSAGIVIFYQLGKLMGKMELFPDWGFFADRGDWRAYTICGRFFDFAVGVLFGMIYIKTKNQLLDRPWLADAAILACCGILAVLFITKGGRGMTSKTGWRLNMQAAAFGAVIIYALCSERSWIARWMSWKPLVYGGQISYALYLVHHDVIEVYRYYIFKHGWDIPWIVAAPALYLSCSVLAGLCFGLIEKPCQRFILVKADIWKPEQ